MGLVSYYIEGGYDPIIKKGVSILLYRMGLESYYKEVDNYPIINKGVMILL